MEELNADKPKTPAHPASKPDLPEESETPKLDTDMAHVSTGEASVETKESAAAEDEQLEVDEVL